MRVIKAKAAQFTIWLVSRFSLKTAQRIGSFLGLLIWKANLEPAKVTRTNLKLCFPELKENELELLVLKSLQNTAMTFIEMGMMWEWPINKTLALVKSVKGIDVWENAKASGHGVIILGPHLGNWELAGLYIATKTKMATLYRPPKIKELESYMGAVRGRTGADLVPANKRGVIKLFSILKSAGVVGILPDQVPQESGGLFAPFFGVNANTIKLVSRLIEKTNAKVVCLYALRDKLGTGFDIEFKEPDEKIYSKDPLVSVTGLNKSVESCVLVSPEQYQWEYKRFKHFLPSEPKFY